MSLSPLKLSLHTDGRYEGVGCVIVSSVSYVSICSNIFYFFRLDDKGKQKAVDEFFAAQLDGISHETLFEPFSLSQDVDTAVECVYALRRNPLNCSH